MQEQTETDNVWINVNFLTGVKQEVTGVVDTGQLQLANPWLMDTVVFFVDTMGHAEELPRSWDWENLLLALQDGEELLYGIDHNLNNPDQVKGHSYTIWLGLRFRHNPATHSSDLVSHKSRRAASIYEQFRRQAFPESRTRFSSPMSTFQHLQGGSEYSSCIGITGYPSSRTLKKEEENQDRTHERLRNFQSLNDIVDSFPNSKFRIVFVLQKVMNEELLSELQFLCKVRDDIYPEIKQSKQENKSSTSSSGKSETEPTVILESALKSITNLTVSASHTVGRWVPFLNDSVPNVMNMLNKGINVPLRFIKVKELEKWEKLTEVKYWKNSPTQYNSGRTESEGEATTKEHINSWLELAEDTIKHSMDCLHEAHGSGGFRWSALVFAESNQVGQIAHSLQGVLSGNRSYRQPLQSFPIDCTNPSAILLQKGLVSDLLKPAPRIMGLNRACEGLLLPEAELPGLGLRHFADFGRCAKIKPLPEENRHGSLVVGYDSLDYDVSKEPVNPIELPLLRLMRHTLIAGATGSGKTNLTAHIINQLPEDGPFVMVLETAKRTYRSLVNRPGRELKVFSLGSSEWQIEQYGVLPFRINPFYFELGTSLKRHFSVLTEALSELIPNEAMIGQYLARAVEQCYVKLGWDIESGQPADFNDPQWPTIIDFVEEVRQVADSLNYGGELSANYRGALESRVEIFLSAPYQDIFCHGGNQSLEELVPDRCDMVLEVEDLPPSDIDIRAFVMTLLLSRLRSLQAREASRKWLLVVEEAHNVLDRQFEERKPGSEANAGRGLLRHIKRLLQEGRSMSIGLLVVDQSPTILAREVVLNTGTKFVMRLEDASEIEEIGKSIGLEEKEWKKIGLLQTGEALIHTQGMEKPIKSAPVPLVISKQVSTSSQTLSYRFKRSAYSTLEQAWFKIFSNCDLSVSTEVDRITQLCDGNFALALYTAYRGLYFKSLRLKDTLKDDAEPIVNRIRQFASLKSVSRHHIELVVLKENLKPQLKILERCISDFYCFLVCLNSPETQNEAHSLVLPQHCQAILQKFLDQNLPVAGLLWGDLLSDFQLSKPLAVHRQYFEQTQASLGENTGLFLESELNRWCQQLSHINGHELIESRNHGTC